MKEKLINHNLLLDRNSLNAFTSKMKEIIDNVTLTDSVIVVKTRYGYLMEVERIVDDAGMKFEGTFGKSKMWWFANGESTDNKNYDIIEIVQ